MTENVFVRCPKPDCGEEFELPKRTAKKAKIIAEGVVGGAFVGAAAGATIGAGVGIAGGGVATAGTVPIGAVGGFAGGVIVGLGAKFGADWAYAKASCPKCGTRFRL